MGIKSLTDRRLQLAIATALAGGAFAVAPAIADAATTTIQASGSSLQNTAQQAWTGTTAGDFGALSPTQGSVKYIATSSGRGLSEFALQADGTTGNSGFNITPTSANVSNTAGPDNSIALDGIIGTDEAPSSTQLSDALAATGSNAVTVPVVSAPIAVIVNLPSSCTVTAKTGQTFVQPIFTNEDIAGVFSGHVTTWNGLLEDAVDAVAGGFASDQISSGCSTSISKVFVRNDSSGTSFVFKQYLHSVNSTDIPTADVNDTAGTAGWPSFTAVSTDGGATQGSGGEASSVFGTAGSIGYVNLADAVNAGFGDETGTSTQFMLNVQNNGTGLTGVAGATPDVSQLGTDTSNCPADYSNGTLPASTATAPDWSGVVEWNSDMAGNPGGTDADSYPICAITFDVAWHNYAATGGTGANLTANPSDDLDSTYAADYSNVAPTNTVAAVGTTAANYLTWVTTALDGQAVVPQYYSALPTPVASRAETIAAAQIG